MKRTVILLFCVLIKTCFPQSNICLMQSPSSPVSPAYTPVYNCSADLDNDGNLEFITHMAPNDLRINFYNGPSVSYTNSLFVGGYILSSDLNNDGNADLAFARPSAGNIGVLLGTGTGSFNAGSTFPVSAGPSYIEKGDFNNDGKTDLAVIHYNSGNVSVILGNGSGGFSAAVTISINAQPTKLIAGDFNNDGKTDLLAYETPNVIFLKGNNNGTFVLNNTITLGANAFKIEIADLDNDGKIDIASVNSTNDVSIYKGIGNFSFQAAVSYSGSTSNDLLAIADLDNDGKKDIIVSSYSQGNFAVLTGAANATFLAPVNFTLTPQTWPSYVPTGNPETITAADYDNDGKIDLALFNDNPASIYLFQNCIITTALKEKTTLSSLITLFPNPAQDRLQVQVNAGTSYKTLAVFDQLGQLIREEEINFKDNIAEIKTNEFPNGVYVLKLSPRSMTDPVLNSSTRGNDNTVSVSKRFIVSR